MKSRILKIALVVLTILILPMSTASAINLGRTVYDSEIPETISDSSFDSENPGINFGLCAGFGDLPIEDCYLSEQEIQGIIEYVPSEETEYAPFIAPTQASPDVISETIVKTVYINEGLTEEQIKELLKQNADAQDSILLFDKDNPKDGEGEGEGKVLGASTVRDTVQPLLDQLSAKVTDLEDKVGQTGTTLQSIILIILVIVLSLLTIRTEVRFQKLAERYEGIKNGLNKKKKA